MVTSLVTRTATGIVTGNVIDPKRAITDMVRIGLADTPHDAKTMTASAAVIASARDRADMSPFNNRKAKQRRGVSASPLSSCKKSHTPKC